MQAHMNGARLAYVVVPQEGEVVREVYGWNKKAGLTKKPVDQPAGFLVYFPRGHVIRLKNKSELRRYKLDQPASIINLEGLANPNSPLGKLMLSQDEATRKGAFQSLEDQVVRLATAKSGKIELTKDYRDLPQHPDAANHDD